MIIDLSIVSPPFSKHCPLSADLKYIFYSEKSKFLILFNLKPALNCLQKYCSNTVLIFVSVSRQLIFDLPGESKCSCLAGSFSLEIFSFHSSSQFLILLAVYTYHILMISP